jgi:hypothetical protein
MAGANMRSIAVVLLNLILVAAAILTSLYSMDHYADGGCDGGLCGLGLLFHALPLALVWVLEIIAFNLSLRKKSATFVLLALALVINTLVYSQNNGYALQELDLEPEILYFLAAVCLALYFRDFNSEKKAERHSEPEKNNAVKKSHPLMFSAALLWVLCSLFSYFRYVISAGWEQVQANVLSTILGLCIWTLQFTLVVYVFKGRLWALIILFALVLYQTITLLIYNFKYEVAFFDTVLVGCNLYLMLALFFQYKRIKTADKA